VSDAIVRNWDDRALFDQVFRPHMAEALRLAQMITGSAVDAEDVVQDAALRAFRGIQSFGALNARAWSLAIVRNTAYRWLTKKRSKVTVPLDELTPTEQQELERQDAHGSRIETPEESVLLNGNVQHIQRVLYELPTPFREVMVLREINQFHYRDIAEVTNVPIGTVMSRLSRGRQLLLAVLAASK
jgi:RNA polymerase sigma-70 factor, ECF subfamily